MLREQQKWQSVNKIGAVVGGTDLVNYSELYHPYSLHNQITGANKPVTLPSDLESATAKFKLEPQGFYAKDTFKPTNTYTQQKETILNTFDPRVTTNPNMWSGDNVNLHTTQINPKLLEEIERRRRGEKELLDKYLVPVEATADKKHTHSMQSIGEQQTTMNSQGEKSPSQYPAEPAIA